jgi:undecaprenyl-diphosphooligosaccharide--protein glycosyltransferase
MSVKDSNQFSEQINSDLDKSLHNWLQSPWIVRILFLVALLICYGISVTVRYQQLEAWKQNPQQFFVGEQPLMTTLDAPFFLRWAKEYRDGEFYGAGHKRSYPSSTQWFREQQAQILANEKKIQVDPVAPLELSTSPTSVPLLSFITAMMSPFFAGNLYLAGHWLVILTGGLFIIPLGFYGWRLGYPIAGLLGGLIGTFCSEYYVRASIGRIDTDMLNIFFPILGAYLVLLACQAKSERWVWLWAAVAGLSINFFVWWYDKPGFALGCFLTLLVGLIIWRHKAQANLPALGVFTFFAGPSNLLSGLGSVRSFLDNYLFVGAVKEAQAQEVVSPVTFPNVFNTISEAAKVPMSEVLQQVLSEPTWGWLGLIAFALFAVRYWPVVIPLLPIVALGLLGFQSSRRFIMFLAPFVGFGLGVLLTIAIRLAWEWIRSRLEPEDPTVTQAHPIWGNANLVGQVLIYVGLFGSWTFFAPMTAISYVPGPSIPPPVYQTFDQVKQLVPENGAIYTWWDYGYAITDKTERAVFNDGGAQLGPTTYFMARSFISSEQEEMRRIIGFLASQGAAGISRFNTSKDALLREVYSGKYKPREPIYVFYTYDMIGKFSALFSIGSWNFDTLQNSVKGYQRLQCSKLENQVLTCQGVTVDLKEGLVNGQIPLRRLVQSIQGRETKIQELKEQGLSLQLMMPNERQFSEIYLMEEAVWASNFNQMYLLGNYDKEVFEEVFHAFPIARLFRLKDLEPL